MEKNLLLCCINKYESNFYLESDPYPFPLPDYATGIMYMLFSGKNHNCAYIGMTMNTKGPFNQHNSGNGAAFTIYFRRTLQFI